MNEEQYTPNHADFNRDNGLPTFSPPATASEARGRIAELNSAIKSIEDQVNVRELSGGADPAWLKKALTSQRFKTLERDRLDNWLLDREDEQARGKNLNDYIVAVVRGDYSAEEWSEVLVEAQGAMEA